MATHMRVTVKTRRQVWRYTALVTLVAVTLPVIAVGAILLGLFRLPLIVGLLGMALAFAIPLLITPPIAYMALSIMRMLGETIDRVDAHVKYDSLTGVLNRAHFLDSMRASAGRGVLMILDADHFKRINDRYGHGAGDQALQALATATRAVVGDSGLTGRLGGEEFGIFLPETGLAEGLARAEAIRAAIGALDMILDDHAVTLTVSIGCAAHGPGTTIGQTLKQADAQLYEAKRAGRNCVRAAG